jgi:hypothetical protein
MLNSNHPFYFLRNELLNQTPGLVLEFSRYIHLGFGKTLSREIIHVASDKLNDSWVENQLANLLDRQELALHSKVYLNNEIYHIPLVDFINISSIENIAYEVKNLNEKLNSKIALFDSGLSLHGYYYCLINEYQWYRYLGSLLLCNPPPNLGEEIIDSRWIGHSLEHGFSALRWSHNTELYQSIPQAVAYSS